MILMGHCLTRLRMESLQQLTGLFSAATNAASLAHEWGVTDAVVGMSAGPTGMGLIAAKWLLSSSLTGSLGAFGASWVLKGLLSHYGDDIVKGLYGTITTEMAKLPPQWGGTPKPPPDPPPLLSLEGALSLIGIVAKHSRALFALLLFLSLQYLHALGAYEMRRAVRARLDARPPASAVAPPAPRADPAAVRAFCEARARETAHSREGDAAKKLDRRVAQEDASIFERLLHALYANHGFYSGQKEAEAAYFTLSGNHPVRMVVNLLLGFMLQMNALLLFRGSPQGDSVAQVARVASVVAYFELLMRALRLYGWAPLYVATRLVFGATTDHKRHI